MIHLSFDNRFIHELKGESSGEIHPRQTHGVCWAKAMPTPVSKPALLAYSSEVSALLNLSDADVQSDDFLAAFSGNRLLPGMAAYATCYGGYQFGHWAGQLGDGRAISLGEATNNTGERWELQLKGAGITPYSRRGDGRAVLRSSLREFLCSEAMHHLGIPTTRALSLIATGESVVRDMFYDGNPQAEPGAIVCRVSPSFIRFGHFELLAARGELDLLRQLVGFTISRDYAEITGSTEERFAAWFSLICEKTAQLVVEWLRVGFVHGVMNTDNMSILGLTIDYGPYGWIDNFDPGWTPNTTDADYHRYGFAQQPAVARWNLEKLAEALMPVSPSRTVFDEGLAQYDSVFQSKLSSMLAAKFGLRQWRNEDADLVEAIFDLMQRAEIDMTEFFRSLAEVKQYSPQVEILRGAFYKSHLFENHRALAQSWLERYARRIGTQKDSDALRRSRMNRVNPRFVLRNYLAQEAIDALMNNELSVIDQLMEAARRPYDENIPSTFIQKRPDWAIHKPGCSMLSCSS